MSFYNGMKVVVTKELIDLNKPMLRVRTHRKKRIDKKYKKIYGFKYQAGDVLIFNNEIFMHPYIHNKLKHYLKTRRD